MKQDTSTEARPASEAAGAADAKAERERRRQDDVALVSATLLRDRAALDRFIDRMGCVPRFVALLNRRCGDPFDPDAASDVVQDALAVIWSKLGAFRGDSSLETWVYQVARFEFLSALRRRSRLPRPIGESLPVADVALVPPEGETEYDRVQQALSQLDPDQRRVIRLRNFEHLDFAEIAARVGVSAETARSRYHRGIRRLRDVLGVRGRER